MQHELLDPLPVRKLWGIGPVAEEKLKRLGIETIGGFARTPIAEVASILGTTVGPGLHRLAQGIDDRPVAERAESKQISAESTFAADIVTMAQLRAAVESSGRAAFSRLEKDGRAARTVVLKLKKSDMSILTRSVTLPFATIDRQILIATAQKQVIDPQELGRFAWSVWDSAVCPRFGKDHFFPSWIRMFPAIRSRLSRAPSMRPNSTFRWPHASLSATGTLVWT